jgi:multidrug efflux pump subunit AcrA (membrane-fusion protein)
MMIDPRPAARYAALAGLTLTLALGPACQKKAPQVAPAAAPVVPVAHPVEQSVIDYVDYTGRLDAVESVGIKARATGFLMRIEKPFEEGAEVS